MFTHSSMSKGYSWFKFMAAAMAVAVNPIHTPPVRRNALVVNTLAPDS